MYQLTLRRHWYLGLLVAALTIGCIIVLPSQSPEKVVKVSVIILIISEVVLSGLMAELFYNKATPSQVITIMSTLAGSIMCFGAIGNFFSAATEALPGSEFVFSWVQLLIMNLGGFLSTVALYELTTVGGSENDDVVMHSFRDRIRGHTPDPSNLSARVVHTGGFTISGPAPNFFLGQNEGSSVADGHDPAVQQEVGTTSLTSQERVAQSTGESRAIQGSTGSSAVAESEPENKEADGNTFFKLQSLFGGSKNPIPKEVFLAKSNSLQSVLDRLDSGEEKTHKPEPPKSKSLPETATDGGSALKSDHPAQTEDLPVKRNDIGSRLVDIVNNNRSAPLRDHTKDLQGFADVENAQTSTAPDADETASKLPALDMEVKARVSAETDELDNVPSVVEAKKDALSEVVSPRAEGPRFTKQELDAIGSKPEKSQAEKIPIPSRDELDAIGAKAAESNQGKPASGIAASLLKGAAKTGLASKFVGQNSSVDTPKFPASAESGGHPALAEDKTNQAAGQKGHASPRSTGSFIFNQSVDAEVDDIFSTLAPPAAQKIFDPSLLERELAELEEDDATPEEITRGEERQAENLFGTDVTESVDAIFSALAPEEAQRQFDPKLFRKEQAPEVVSPTISTHALPEEEKTAEEESINNLFGQRIDESVDEIFSVLAPDEAQREVSESQYAKGKEALEEEVEEDEVSEIQATAPDGSAQEAGEGPFHLGVDEQLEDIFSHLAPPEAQRTVAERVVPFANVSKTGVQQEEEDIPASSQEGQEEVSPAEMEAEEYDEEEYDEYGDESDDTVINPITKNLEVREFGRLATKKLGPPDPTAPVGTMKTIGKLLLDVGAIENIIKTGEAGPIGSGLTNARIISAARGEGIKGLLGRIDAYEGVTGSLIVGHDGLVIASTLGPGLDKDSLGVLSTVLLDTSNLATLRLDVGKLRQMVLFTQPDGENNQRPLTTVLTDVEVGILAVFLDSQDISQIDGLLDSIHRTVHG
jgi:uncharacterized protein